MSDTRRRKYNRVVAGSPKHIDVPPAAPRKSFHFVDTSGATDPKFEKELEIHRRRCIQYRWDYRRAQRSYQPIMAAYRKRLREIDRELDTEAKPRRPIFIGPIPPVFPSTNYARRATYDRKLYRWELQTLKRIVELFERCHVPIPTNGETDDTIFHIQQICIATAVRSSAVGFENLNPSIKKAEAWDDFKAGDKADRQKRVDDHLAIARQRDPRASRTASAKAVLKELVAEYEAAGRTGPEPPAEETLRTETSRVTPRSKKANKKLTRPGFHRDVKELQLRSLISRLTELGSRLSWKETK